MVHWLQRVEALSHWLLRNEWRIGYTDGRLWKFKSFSFVNQNFLKLCTEMGTFLLTSSFKNITNIDISDVCIEKMKDEAIKKSMEMKCENLFWLSFMYGCHIHGFWCQYIWYCYRQRNFRCRNGKYNLTFSVVMTLKFHLKSPQKWEEFVRKKDQL